METKEKLETTYDELMRDPEFAKELKKEVEALHLSELLIELMEKNKMSVRKLADKAHLSPAVIQGIRSGTRKNASITSVTNIFHAMGYDVVLKNKNEEYQLV